MGNQLFGIDIAGIIAGAIGDAVFDVTITRAVRGARAAGSLTSGPATSAVKFSAKGFWEDFTGMPPPGVTLELNDRKAILIGDTIETGGVPQRNDAITVHEDVGDSTLYVVKLISRDPAAAAFTYLCRDRAGPDGA